jgi:hypothetical protein
MRQNRHLAFLLAAGLTTVAARAAAADVLINVDKAVQEMTVSVDGAERYRWPVSTARAGYATPNGAYRPIRLDREWFSRKYDNSPMPYSIFFHGGYAIHGSYERKSIGHPASHGCVRLDPKNAERLFELVEAEGPDKTRIVIGGPGRSHDQLETRSNFELNGRPSAAIQRGARFPIPRKLADGGPGAARIDAQAPSNDGRSRRLVDPFSELISYLQNQ